MEHGGPPRKSIIPKLIACGLLGGIGVAFLFMAAIPVFDRGGGASGQEARSKVTVTDRVIDAAIFGSVSIFFFTLTVSVAREKR